MDKDKAKKEYIELYKQIYKDIEEDRQMKAFDLIQNLAMVRVTIDECDEHIAKEGVVVQMCQGDYSIDRENPYVKIQDRAQRTYTNLLKQLDEMLPTNKAREITKAGDWLKKFAMEE